MQLRKWGLAALGFALGLAGANASAATNVPIQRSGNVYNVSVCGSAANRGEARCFARVVTDARGTILEKNSAVPGPPKGYGPADLRSAYNIPANAGSAAITVAIVDAYGYNNAEADLSVYRQQFGLGACTTANGCFRKVDQRGGTNYPRQNTGWAQETALDLDMVSAICPNCRILLVETDTNSLANLAAGVNTAAALGAHVISNSYGGGEGGSAPYNSSYNHSGIAITVSSGDSGFGVQFPASSQYVTAVGGTSLYQGGSPRGWTETVWNGAGSGCSALYPKPTWQTDPLCSMRTVADVSAVADPATGVAVYGPVTQNRSNWAVYGGTSVAAPLIGGVYGVNAGPVTYGSDPYTKGNYATNLYDVTSGSNGSCGGTYLCTGQPGYDGPTGLGTPNGPSAF